MPMLVSSTSVLPPRFRKSVASSMAVCSSARNQLSMIGLRARVRSSLSMVRSCSHRRQSVAGVLSSGVYVPGGGDKQVLVHQGDAELVRVYGAADSHCLAGHVWNGCGHGGLLGVVAVSRWR